MLVDDIVEGLAEMEGYYTSGTLANRNNNPGNLRSWVGTPVSERFAKFATPDDGFAALRQQVQLNINRGLTLQEFFAGKPGVYPGYAPAADSNRPIAYAAFVAQIAGIAVDVPLDVIAAGADAIPTGGIGGLMALVLGAVVWYSVKG